MGTVPTPTTYTAGTELHAADLNNDRDTMNFLKNPPMAFLRTTVAQFTSHGTWTPVWFFASDLDTDGAHTSSPNPERYTAQTAGWYLCSGSVAWDPNNTGRRLIRWAKNGAEMPSGRSDHPAVQGSNYSVFPAVTRLIHLNVGEYVQLDGYQDCGGGLNYPGSVLGVGGSMTVRWVAP